MFDVCVDTSSDVYSWIVPTTDTVIDHTHSAAYTICTVCFCYPSVYCWYHWSHLYPIQFAIQLNGLHWRMFALFALRPCIKKVWSPKKNEIVGKLQKAIIISIFYESSCKFIKAEKRVINVLESVNA